MKHSVFRVNHPNAIDHRVDFDGTSPTVIAQDNLLQYFKAGGGTPEQPLIDWAAHEFADPSKAFVDIGAHVGSWTINLARKFSHVYAFEPQREPFYCLCGGVALSGVSDRVTARQLALGEQGGPWEKVLGAITADGGTGSIVGPVHQNNHCEHLERVQGARLDDFTFEPIGLVKIDVEGAELDVLKGAQQTLIKHGRPPFFFECWADERGQRRDQLFAFVKAFGYETHQMNGFPEIYLAVRK